MQVAILKRQLAENNAGDFSVVQYYSYHVKKKFFLDFSVMCDDSGYFSEVILSEIFCLKTTVLILLLIILLGKLK